MNELITHTYALLRRASCREPEVILTWTGGRVNCDTDAMKRLTDKTNTDSISNQLLYSSIICLRPIVDPRTLMIIDWNILILQ